MSKITKALGALLLGAVMLSSACSPDGKSPLGGRSAQANSGTTVVNPPSGGSGGGSASNAPSGGGNTNPSGGSSQFVTDTVSFTLVDGRSFDPRRTLDGNYADTGVGKRANWTVNVEQGMTLLAFGVRLDDGTKVYDRGVLKAYAGPTSVKLDITDGAWIKVPNDRAPGEACARVKQHVENSWLMSVVEVPSSYASICGSLLNRK